MAILFSRKYTGSKIRNSGNPSWTTICYVSLGTFIHLFRIQSHTESHTHKIWGFKLDPSKPIEKNPQVLYK